MTIMNHQGTERVLGRRIVRMWDLIQCEWAGDDVHRWKQLACIYLRLHCDWSFHMIGRAMGHSAGHTQRLINDGMAALERERADVDLERELAADDVPTALLVPATMTELRRRIIHCQQELDVWQRLRDQRMERRRRRGPSSIRLRIVPGSLRERIAELLDGGEPRRRRTIARKLREESHVVLTTLWACPEFVCDARGDWSLHRFRGQEQMGIDVEAGADEEPGFGRCRMKAFTRTQEQALVVGDTIRILVLGAGADGVRLGIDAPAGLDVQCEESWEPAGGRRRDLVVWHPDPHRLVERLIARFPAAAQTVRVVRTSVAYFGVDPCLYAQMTTYLQGVRDGERSGARDVRSDMTGLPRRDRIAPGCEEGSTRRG